MVTNESSLKYQTICEVTVMYTFHLTETIFYNFCHVMRDTKYSLLLLINNVKIGYVCINSFRALMIIPIYFHRCSI